jgi:hypothetical protein
MTEGTSTRAKHSPDEIKQNHLNAAERSLNAAAKRVKNVNDKRDKVKAQAATIDSEHGAAVAMYNGARERYRHAHIVAKGSEPDTYPDVLSAEGVETDPHDVPDVDETDAAAPADDDDF